MGVADSGTPLQSSQAHIGVIPEVYIHSKGVVHKDLKGQNLLLLHNTCQPQRFGSEVHGQNLQPGYAFFGAFSFWRGGTRKS